MVANLARACSAMRPLVLATTTAQPTTGTTQPPSSTLEATTEVTQSPTSTTQTTTEPVNNHFQFTGFSASPLTIEVEKETEVTFTATVETNMTLPEYSIYVYYVEGERNITYLTDNGDGSFSWTITLTGEKEGEIATFQARYGDYVSGSVEIRFTGDGTEIVIDKD